MKKIKVAIEKIPKSMYQAMATVIAPFILILIGYLYRIYEEDLPLWLQSSVIIFGIINLSICFIVCLVKSCEEEV